MEQILKSELQVKSAISIGVFDIIEQVANKRARLSVESLEGIDPMEAFCSAARPGGGPEEEGRVEGSLHPTSKTGATRRETPPRRGPSREGWPAAGPQGASLEA